MGLLNSLFLSGLIDFVVANLRSCCASSLGWRGRRRLESNQRLQCFKLPLCLLSYFSLLGLKERFHGAPTIAIVLLPTCELAGHELRLAFLCAALTLLGLVDLSTEANRKAVLLFGSCC